MTIRRSRGREPPWRLWGINQAYDQYIKCCSTYIQQQQHCLLYREIDVYIYIFFFSRRRPQRPYCALERKRERAQLLLCTPPRPMERHCCQQGVIKRGSKGIVKLPCSSTACFHIAPRHRRRRRLYNPLERSISRLLPFNRPPILDKTRLLFFPTHF